MKVVWILNNGINNGNSNTYDQIAKTSCSISFSDLFKALREDDKKVPCRAETPVKSPSTDGNILLVNILQSFETEKNA